MTSKDQKIQTIFLNTLRKDYIQVSICLISGVRLTGRIESFDQFVVLLKNTISQAVFKHAISTIVPERSVKIPSLGQ